MATTVTIDSKILVLSPSNMSESRAYEGDAHAPLHLQQQPEHGPVAMNRNMSENEHSAATTTSSMSTQLASPATTLTKNVYSANGSAIGTWDYKQRQHHPRQHHDEIDDFYSGQQSPLLTQPTQPSVEVDQLSPNTMPPSMVDSNDSKDQYQNAMVRMGTPPSTLYHEHPPTHSHLISVDAEAIANPVESSSKEPSNNPNMTSNIIKKSKEDTDVSPAGPAFLGDGGDDTINANNGATRKSRKSQQLKQQPVLYSAIGSLENCSANSLKDIRRKNKQQQPGGNGFHSSKYTKFDTVHLIAPPSANHKNILTSQPASSSSILSQQQTSHQTTGKGNTDSATTTAAGQASAQSTPDKFGDIRGQQQPSTPGGIGSHHQQHQSSALKESLRTMQEKIDARNRQQYGCSAHSNHNPRVSMPGPATQTDLTGSAETESALTKQTPKRSSMRKGRSSTASHDEDGKKFSKKQSSKSSRKSVTIEDASLQRKQRKPKQPMEMFRPSSDAYTPRMGRKKITYKPAAQRTPVQKMATTMGTLSRPNFRDALRRVAMLMRQHIVKIEQRFQMPDVRNDEEGGLFKMSMKDAFSEEKFATCRYKCTVVRVPMARPGMVFGMKKIRPKYEIPSEEEIYEFAHQLFQTVQLSSECSIVCLIYIERLMEVSKVPLLASTWRPIFMCGLLLASKVWQDLSSWNIEFASVYPQFSLDAINKLELQFLRMVKWDLYISSRLVSCIGLDGIIVFWELFANPVFVEFTFW